MSSARQHSCKHTACYPLPVLPQQLGVGDICAAWAAALKPADADTDPALALKCAQLLSAMATGQPGASYHVLLRPSL